MLNQKINGNVKFQIDWNIKTVKLSNRSERKHCYDLEIMILRMAITPTAKRMNGRCTAPHAQSTCKSAQPHRGAKVESVENNSMNDSDCLENGEMCEHSSNETVTSGKAE